MPRYLVKHETWISHMGLLAREGDEVDIDWPKGTEPKKLGENMELVEGDKPKRSKQAEQSPA